MVKKSSSTVPAYKPENSKKDKEELVAENNNVVEISDAAAAWATQGEDAPKKHAGGRPRLTDDQKKIKMTLYLPKQLNSDLEDALKKRMVSKNAFIVQAIIDAIADLK